MCGNPRRDRGATDHGSTSTCTSISIPDLRISSANGLGLEGVLDLTMHFGIHSRPITTGVLRFQKHRFELFGDTINTASRVESTSLPNRILLSSETAALLRNAGREDWTIPRRDKIIPNT